ncbi:MAG: metallophosphoesterase [Kiritimatiellae bacterium]|nr:metallophosphoesterase [Kiritimatiellia bacterium]
MKSIHVKKVCQAQKDRPLKEMQRRDFLRSVSAVATTLGFPSLWGRERERPLLTLGVVSDTHIGPREAAANFEQTLRFFRDRKVDAVMNCGDLADWGLRSGFRYVAEAWNKVFPGGKGAEGRPVRKLFCTGNHDYEGWWYPDMAAEMHALGYSEDDAAVKLGMKDCWEEVFQEEFAPIRRRTVNGFDFISAEWYGRDMAPGHNLAPDWLREHGGELDPSKPFFFFLHAPPAETTTGSFSNNPVQRQITQALSAFPNAISISGHAHRTINDERTIWQGAFTAVSVPSLSHAGVRDGGYENGGDVRDGTSSRAMPIIPARLRRERPQGLVVTVFRDRMELERYDFVKFVHTAPTWHLPLPVTASNRPYEPKAHAARIPVPEFSSDAALSLRTRNTETRGGNWEIVMIAEFPAATAVRNARAFDYELRAVPIDGAKPMVKRFLSPAFHKLKEEEPSRMKFWFNVLDLPQDVEYRIEAYPRNCFGVCGKPLVSALRRGKPGGKRSKGIPPPVKSA